MNFLKKIIIRQLLIYICIISTSTASASFKFTNASENSDCEYYKELSEHLGCDEENYLTKFAYHYCTKFNHTSAKYSKEGQDVLLNIRTCLIQSMEQAALNENDHGSLTCPATEGIGLTNHVDCYVKSGFCEIKSSERVKIGLTINVQLLKPKMQKVYREIYRRCGL